MKQFTDSRFTYLRQSAEFLQNSLIRFDVQDQALINESF